MTGALDDLDPEQRAAATAVSGSVCIIAGAGTGKTRTVTHRLAYGVASGAVDPARALAVTHSRKAAAQLGERLAQLGVRAVDARTFHAAGLRVVKVFWGRTGRPEVAPSVLSDSEGWRYWRDSVRTATGHEPDTSVLRDVIDEVGWARSRLVDVEGYSAAAKLAGRSPGVEPEAIARAWGLFRVAKDRSGKLDFADLLEMAAGLLERDDDVAAKVRHRWAHVTVDEYQDTDPSQQRLLDAILGPGTDICVVGDPRQAIYSWKGADPSYLAGFGRKYPGAKVFDLTRNYRSSPQILTWANRLARSRGTKELLATQPAGRGPKVAQLDNEAAEAAWVAGAAKRLIAGGTPAGEVAVLYRFNSTQARFEAAFARADVAAVVADDTTFFDRDEIRSVMANFERAVQAEPGSSGLGLLLTALSRSGFDRDRPPAGLGAARARWESQLALVELAETSSTGTVDGATLLAEIGSLATRTQGPSANSVTLATLHKAKGLEWDVVFLVGMTDGAMPSAFAESADELAEEERLLHVGVTRARRELNITWPATNSRHWANKASPLLDQFSVVAGQAEALPGRKRLNRLSAERAPARLGRGSSGRGRHANGADRHSAAADCPHCAAPLKGIAARRLGICAHCVTSAPGEIGKRARALAVVIKDAAAERSLDSEQVVSAHAMLRLLDLRPGTAETVAATAGVGLKGQWAQAAADVLVISDGT